MDNKHLEGLDPAFRKKLEIYLEWLRVKKGVTMVPYFGIRSPQVQATLWRQSRSSAEVKAGIAKLKKDGAPFLASLLEKGAPASGPWVTNALPGQSWHQFGNSMDSYWLVNGKVSWDTKNRLGQPENGYQLMASFAQQFGLHSLARIGDYPHLQSSAASGPHLSMSWPDIDKAMKAKFG